MNFNKRWLGQIQYILLYLMSFALIGVASLITTETGFINSDPRERFIFIIQLLLSYTATIIIIIATLMSRIDKFKVNDADYLAVKKDIRDFTQFSYRPSIFSRYCQIINNARKRKQFEHNLNAKILLLDKTATDEDIFIWGGEDEEAQKTNPYCRKRALLEAQLEDKWVDKHIKSIQIEYDQITAGVILGGDYKDNNNMANDFVIKDKNKKLARDQLPRLLTSFALITFASSILFDFEWSLSAAINIFIKTLTLIWNVYITINYADNWNETVIMHDMRFRRCIIVEYTAWLRQQIKDKFLSDDDAKADVVGEVVEDNRSIQEVAKEFVLQTKEDIGFDKIKNKLHGGDTNDK